MISILTALENQINNNSGIATPLKVLISLIGAKMAVSPVDRNEKYMKEMWGTTKLITDYNSLPKKQVLQEVMHDDLSDEYKIPEDRLSKPCGGSNGFDDFVERWHE
jgi:hypothetical protein